MPSEEKEDEGTHRQALEESWLGLPVLDGAASVGKQREVDSGSRKRVYVFPKPLFMCHNHSRAGYSRVAGQWTLRKATLSGMIELRVQVARFQRTLAHFLSTSPSILHSTKQTKIGNTKETD